MKQPLYLMLGLGLALVGCVKKEEPKPQQATNKPAASGNPITAPVDYLAASVKAHQSMVKTIEGTSLNQAVQQFYVGEGRFPKDLNELVKLKYIGEIPRAPNGMKIVYDAANGQVKVVPQ